MSRARQEGTRLKSDENKSIRIVISIISPAKTTPSTDTFKWFIDSTERWWMKTGFLYFFKHCCIVGKFQWRMPCSTRTQRTPKASSYFRQDWEILRSLRSEWMERWYTWTSGPWFSSHVAETLHSLPVRCESWGCFWESTIRSVRAGFTYCLLNMESICMGSKDSWISVKWWSFRLLLLSLLMWVDEIFQSNLPESIQIIFLSMGTTKWNWFGFYSGAEYVNEKGRKG